MISNSMRKNYAEYGVQGFYESVRESYRNPHFEQIKKIVYKYMNEWLRLDVKSRYQDSMTIFCTVLDLACGSGEVTVSLNYWCELLSELKIQLNIVACDPFTADAYLQRTGRDICHPWSFDDISNGALDSFDENLIFDVVIVSFALHLLDVGKLMSFCLQLARKCKYFLLISPHKKPLIKVEYGFILVESVYIDRVHGKLFKSNLV